MKEETESTDLVPQEDTGKNGQLSTDLNKIIQVNGDRMTPDMLRELVSKNPDKVCSALRMWSSRK